VTPVAAGNGNPETEIEVDVAELRPVNVRVTVEAADATLLLRLMVEA